MNTRDISIYLSMMFIFLIIFIIDFRYEKIFYSIKSFTNDIIYVFYLPSIGLKEGIIDLTEINSNFNDISKLEAKNRELATQNERLKIALNYYKERYERLSSYRSLSSSIIRVIPATVLTKNIFQTTREFVIDKGKDYAMRTDLPVLDYKTHALIGKTVRITNMTSTVKLIVDSRFKMRVTVVSKDGSEAEGLLNGSGGDKITIDYIEKNKEIKKGDKVYVSKESELSSILSGVNESILVGKVQEVKNSEQFQYYQQLIVLPAVNFKDVEDVLVLESSKKMEK